MDLDNTQIFPDDENDHNLTFQSSKSSERINQVATLCIEDKKYPIYQGINTIGRNLACDITLDDISVSKNHAEIEAHAKIAFVCDLRSSNKTRLKDEILRPQRFYEVSDGADISFGKVKAHYFFLPDANNTIVVPETPTTVIGKNRRNLINLPKRNLNNTTILECDEDIVIPATQTQENDDDRVFAVPSPRSRRQNLKVSNKAVKPDKKKISIHDQDTQQCQESQKIDDSIYNCDTQKLCDTENSDKTDNTNNENIYNMETQLSVEEETKDQSKNISNIQTEKSNDTDNTNDIDNIYIAETQEVMPTKKVQQSIYDLETQRNDMIDDDAEHNVMTQKVENPKQSGNKLIIRKVSTINKTKENIDAISRNQDIHNIATQIYDRDTTEVESTEKVQSIYDLETQKNDMIDDDAEHNVITQKVENPKQSGNKLMIQKSSIITKETVGANRDGISRNQDIHNIATQIYDRDTTEVESTEKVQSIYDLETQKNDMIDDDAEHNVMTQKVENPKQSGNKLMIQKSSTITKETVDAIRDGISRNQDIHNIATQKYDWDATAVESTNKLNKDKSATNNVFPVSKISEKVNGNGKNELLNAVAKTLSHESAASEHIIDETDSETDEEGVFSNALVNEKESANSDTQVNPTNDNDNGNESETDEEGEFSSLKPDSTIEEDATQIIENLQKVNNSLQNVSTHRGSEWDDYDDTAPTQIIDVQATRNKKESKTQSNNKDDLTKSKSNQKESDEADKISNDNAQQPMSSKLKSKMVVRLERIDNISTAVSAKKLKKSDNINDVSMNLENLFGDENQESNIVDPIPLGTQQLHEILENVDTSNNKTITRIQSENNSTDNDSEDTYFLQMHSKRKRNILPSNTDSENIDDSPSTTSDNSKYVTGVSGFDKGVAVDSEKSVEISKSSVVETVPEKSTSKVGDGNEEEKEDDDILAGLPEVRIYGTELYPASPSSSVCSLDEWLPYEKKRQEAIKASKARRKLATSKLSPTKTAADNPKEKTPEKRRSPGQSSKAKSESSDDEDINFEDLKKMADGYIAGDAKGKKSPVKPEIIPTTKDDDDSMIVDNVMEPVVALAEETDVAKKRGRPKKKILSSVPTDEKGLEDKNVTIDEPLPRKRARLRKKSSDSLVSNSDSVIKTADVEENPVKTPPKEENKRVRKVPNRIKDFLSTPRVQKTPRSKKTKEETVVESPSGSNRSRIQHKIIFTGIHYGDYETGIKQCGGVVIEAPDQATILVTDKIRRTCKFFCAISRHIPIVSINWIEDSIKAKQFLDWNEYLLKDSIHEAKYKFKLKESLERASKKQLMEGYTFLITNKVTQPGVEEIKNMIHMSGGKALIRAPKMWLANTIIISCPEDLPKVLCLLAKTPDKLDIPVYNTEFLLSGILKQELNFNANKMNLRTAE